MSSERKHISSGSAFEADIGYSRAVVDGDMIFVSGCTGYDYETSHISDDIEMQTQQCMLNIESALKQVPAPTGLDDGDNGNSDGGGGGGAEMSDIVRVRYILPDRADFPKIAPILRAWLGEVKPAATMIQAGLMDERMKIEIEVTAIRRRKQKEVKVEEPKGVAGVLRKVDLPWLGATLGLMAGAWALERVVGAKLY